MHAIQSELGVFLSHRESGKPFVRFLKDDLVAHGVDVWLDENELRIADRLPDEITSAIRACPYFAACFSGPASPWMAAEIAVAIACGATILPVLIGEASPEDISKGLQDLLYADLRKASDYNKMFARLLAVIDRTVDCQLEMNVFRKEQLTQAAGDRALVRWVTDYALDCVTVCPDATQRFWAYHVLREIGTPEARAAIARGVEHETEPFALRGAREAYQLLVPR